MRDAIDNYEQASERGAFQIKADSGGCREYGLSRTANDLDFVVDAKTGVTGRLPKKQPRGNTPTTAPLAFRRA
jgi:hypothetical protein